MGLSVRRLPAGLHGGWRRLHEYVSVERSTGNAGDAHHRCNAASYLDVEWKCLGVGYSDAVLAVISMMLFIYLRRWFVGLRAGVGGPQCVRCNPVIHPLIGCKYLGFWIFLLFSCESYASQKRRASSGVRARTRIQSVPQLLSSYLPGISACATEDSNSRSPSFARYKLRLMRTVWGLSALQSIGQRYHATI